MSKGRKRWHTYPDRPLSMVFFQYAPSRYSNEKRYGHSPWLENRVADHLIKSIKKPAKRAAGTRPVYVVRCYPRQIGPA